MKATERIKQFRDGEIERYAKADSRFDEHYRMYNEAALVRGIGMYLDEEQVRREAWEKSVEERLASSRLTVERHAIAKRFDDATRFDEEKPPAVRIHDPGPSRYDHEPTEIEE